MVPMLFVVDAFCIWCGDDDGVVDIPILFELLMSSCSKCIVTTGSYDVDIDGVVDDVSADNNTDDSRMLALMMLVDASLMLIVRVGICGCIEMCGNWMRVLGKYGIYEWFLWTKPHIQWRE